MALLTLAGGTLAASAAATPEAFTAYFLSVNWTNAGAGFWSVNGLPFGTNATPPFVSAGGSLRTFGDPKHNECHAGFYHLAGRFRQNQFV